MFGGKKVIGLARQPEIIAQVDAMVAAATGPIKQDILSNNRWEIFAQFLAERPLECRGWH